VEVIKSYYSSQSNQDDQWKDLWSDDGVFSDASQTLLANGKEAVIQAFTPFLKGVTALKIAHGNSRCPGKKPASKTSPPGYAWYEKTFVRVRWYL
jgi:hypothetical protein